jgi:mannose-6-phosphate isomerase-like protein (cupin superfamily)
MKGYKGNIEEISLANSDFRRVLYTGPHSQLVVMSLLPGEEIGLEIHDKVDQFLRVESGEGIVVMDGQEAPVSDGDSVVVPAGVEHNLINTTKGPLKLYTIYSPPHHRDGTVHPSKQDAEADTEDHI